MCSDLEGMGRQAQSKSVKFSVGITNDARTTSLPPLRTPPTAAAQSLSRESTQVKKDEHRPGSTEKMAVGDKSNLASGITHRGTPELPSITKPGSGKPGSGRSRPSSTSSRRADPNIVLTYLKKKHL